MLCMAIFLVRVKKGNIKWMKRKNSRREDIWILYLVLSYMQKCFFWDFAHGEQEQRRKKQDVSYIIIVDFLLFAASFLQSILMYRS